jgi:hypothetical protein
MPKFLALTHLLVRRSTVSVCLHQWSKNPEPLPGDHSRVGMRDLAAGRSKHNTMPTLAQSAPRHPCLGRVEIMVRKWDEDSRHGEFHTMTRYCNDPASTNTPKIACYGPHDSTLKRAATFTING